MHRQISTQLFATAVWTADQHQAADGLDGSGRSSTGVCACLFGCLMHTVLQCCLFRSLNADSLAGKALQTSTIVKQADTNHIISHSGVDKASPLRPLPPLWLAVTARKVPRVQAGAALAQSAQSTGHAGAAAAAEPAKSATESAAESKRGRESRGHPVFWGVANCAEHA